LQRNKFNDLNLGCERLPNIEGGEEAGTGEKGVALKENEPGMGKPFVVDSWRHSPIGPLKGIVPLLNANGISVHLSCPEGTPDKGSGGHFHEPHPFPQYFIILELLGRQITDHGVVFL
jgi:hypothetical protein